LDHHFGVFAPFGLGCGNEKGAPGEDPQLGSKQGLSKQLDLIRAGLGNALMNIYDHYKNKYIIVISHHGANSPSHLSPDLPYYS
jgi:hypothetical protein